MHAIEISIVTYRKRELRTRSKLCLDQETKRRSIIFSILSAGEENRKKVKWQLNQNLEQETSECVLIKNIR